MFNKLRASKGYTLPEMMAAAAIIAIIAAISIGGILSQIKNVRQMKLDNTARTIYTAAQNRLTELYSSGDTAHFENIYKRANEPSDWDGDDFESGKTLTLIRSDYNYSKTGSTLSAEESESLKSLLFPEGTLAADIYHHNWIIEFNPEDGYVYAVLYGEGDASLPELMYDEPEADRTAYDMAKIRSAKRSERLKETDAQVGYFAGQFSLEEKTEGAEVKLSVITANSLEPNNEVTDRQREPGDELKLTFKTVIQPKKGTAASDYRLDYLVTIKGATSGSTYTYELLNIRGALAISRSLIIDRLIEDESVGGANDLSFYKNFCSGAYPSSAQSSDEGGRLTCTHRDGNMIPGENLIVTFTVKPSAITSEPIIEKTADPVTINSLFGNDTAIDLSGSTAAISCARHLQNLDTKTSHVGEPISGTINGGASALTLNFTKAVQRADIDFENARKGYYANIYNNRAYTPIVNHKLRSFTGSHNGRYFTIKNITCGYRPGADKTKATVGGLFGSFAGESLTDIRVVSLRANDDNGTMIKNAGALAAELNDEGLSPADIPSSSADNFNLDKTIYIDNCRVYLEKDSYDKDGAKLDDSYSFIKVNAADAGSAGGLIGLANVGVVIRNSFAATTVETKGSGHELTGAESQPAQDYYGRGAGGLIGWARGNVTISGSYADCYLTGAYIGGLAGYITDKGNKGSSISGSYSAGFARVTKETLNSAGIAGNMSTAALNLRSIYSVFDTGSPAVSPHTAYHSTVNTLAGGAAPEAVYVLSLGTARNDIAGTFMRASAELKAEGVLNDLNAKLSSSETRFIFNRTSAATSAYTLRKGLELKIYEYPHLRYGAETEHQKHWGDWLEKDLVSGKLVYFEQYNDGKWGFAGNNANTLYAEDELNEARWIISDGYALLYDKGDYDALYDKENAIRVSYNNGDISATLGSAAAQEVAGTMLAAPSEAWAVDSVFLLLPDNIVNNGLEGTIGGAAYSGYYQRLAVTNPEGTDYYNFAPHFARSAVPTETDTEMSMLSAGDYIYIRTPRQLYLMSRFYGSYSTESAGCIFRQEADLDYKLYHWTGTIKAAYNSLAHMADASRAQSPIADGSSIDETFKATYNGAYHKITGFNIVSGAGKFHVGLFGAVDNGGKLRNITISTDYKTHTYRSESTGSVSGTGARAYYGLLAGYVGADCEVYNCAAANYTTEGYAYGSSELYAGGLIGYNEGAVSNSSAVTPRLKMHTNGSSRAYIGGLTGYNSSRGELGNCYSLYFADAGRSDAIGSLMLGGLAGMNYGRIESSYCAMSYVSSNIDAGSIAAFANGSLGQVSRSFYLNGGNYYFADSVHLYSYEEGNIVATPLNGAQLKGMAYGTDATYNLSDLSGEYGRADVSADHTATTEAGGEADYPYPAVVRNAQGRVHYGEWTFDSDYGDMGFVYWEHESGGTNNGYHFYIIDDKGHRRTTLCEAHDDGGVIKSYGYGYYHRTGLAVNAAWDKVNIGAAGFEDAKTDIAEVSGAKSALEKQFGNVYTFELYRTTEKGVEPRTGGKRKAADGGMYITDNSAFASCTVSDGTESRTYVFTPFFAKSMVLTGTYTPKDGGNELTVSADDARDLLIGHNTGFTSTGRKLDYEELIDVNTPDGRGFPFEIRSASQLQNINWRWDELSALTQLLTVPAWEIQYGTTNYYTYLKWYAYGDRNYGKSVNESSGHNFYWKQSHDTDSHGSSFMPIGGLYDKVGQVNWLDPVSESYVAYFNGDYNGDSYKIQNVNILSKSQTVGLFGATVCANLRNIILYSDAKDKIATDSAGLNWYCLGGLVGFAAQGSITNCAVAGYTIQDNRIYSGAGDADVGGLAGFCATNITGCSSVNDIIIARGEKTNLEGYHTSGTVFAGGMAGICPGTILNSYCGGTISSTSDSSTELYIGGFIGGEWFRASGLQGLTKFRDLERKLPESAGALPNPTIKNCYSYITLPKSSRSEIKVLAPLASAGNLNRYSAALGVPINVHNCYYYGAYAGIATDTPKVLITMAAGNNAGQSFYNFNYTDALGNSIDNSELKAVMSLSYDKMKSLAPDGSIISGSLAAKLNADSAGAFRVVSTTENGGIVIRGKYSFPGSDTELGGENFPFPTIVTQANPFYDAAIVTGESPTVNVHYGKWPKSDGLFTDRSAAAIDLLSSPTGEEVFELKFYRDGFMENMAQAPVITYSSSGTAESTVAQSALTAVTEDGKSYYKLTVKGLTEGYEALTAAYTDAAGQIYTNTIDISVTAEMSIEIKRLDATHSDIYVGETAEYELRAINRDGNVITTTKDNWGVQYAESSAEYLARVELKMAFGRVILAVTGGRESAAPIPIYVNTIDIYPLYDTGGTGTPVASRYGTLTVNIKADPASMVTGAGMDGVSAALSAGDFGTREVSATSLNEAAQGVTGEAEADTDTENNAPRVLIDPRVIDNNKLTYE